MLIFPGIGVLANVVGMNLLDIIHIRVANLLPALVLATAWSWIF